MQHAWNYDFYMYISDNPQNFFFTILLFRPIKYSYKPGEIIGNFLWKMQIIL